MDTGSRIAEIQKRLNNDGGYDFYKPLQNAVRTHCRGETLAVDDILAAPTNDTEQKHNKEAFEKFKSKFGSIKTLDAVKDRKALTFHDFEISITIDPLFECTKSGGRQIYSLWPTQKPKLTQRYGAVACHIMRQAYTSEALGNGSFYFADLVGNKVYSEKQITENTALILASDARSIGTLIKEL
jgi:hypothetical protein